MYDAFCRAVGAPLEMAYMIDDVTWLGYMGLAVNFLDSVPKLFKSPETIEETESGAVIPKLDNASDSMLLLYKAFYRGMDAELDGFIDAGEITPAKNTFGLFVKDKLMGDIMRMFEAAEMIGENISPRAPLTANSIARNLNETMRISGEFAKIR